MFIHEDIVEYAGMHRLIRATGRRDQTQLLKGGLNGFAGTG